MNKLNRLSLAVIAALGLGLSGCGSSSSSSSHGTIIDDFAVMVSRGDVYGATVTDSASIPNVATQVEGTNEYKFDIPESQIVFPVKVNGGYVDVNGDGKIEADVDMKLNIEMKSYESTVTPVTTYLADETSESAREAKLQDLVDLVKEVSDVDNISADELLKTVSDSTISTDAQIVINALYSEMVDANDVNLDLASDDDLKADFEIELKKLDDLDLDGSIKENAAKLELDVIKDLNLPTLSADDIKTYLNDLSEATSTILDEIKSVSDLQGETLYTMDLEADPATYTKIELPSSISTDTELTTTTYELEDGEWKEQQNSDLDAKATLDDGELTLTMDDGKKVTKNVIDTISLDGISLSTDLSVKDLTDSFNMNGDFSEEEDGTIYLEMTAEMQDPSTIE